MKYFCLCDLDGTLLNDKNEIDKDSIDIINRLNDKIRIILVSKSDYTKLLKLKDKYNINVDIFSSESKIALINNKLFYNELDNNIINNIINKFDNSIYTAYGTGLGKGYIYKYEDRLKSLYPNDYISYPDKLTNLFLSIFNEEYDSFINYLEPNKIPYKLIFKDYKKALINIYSKRFEKKEAYDLAYNEYHTSSIGITDSIVDKDMLENCNIKIAMANGDLEIKNYCKIITEFDNNNSGAMKALLAIL